MDSVLSEAGIVRGVSPGRGQGLFASRNLPTGFVLRVPRSCCFSAQFAAVTPFGRKLLAASGDSGSSSGCGGWDAEEICIAVLADARRGNGANDSDLGSWVARMPHPAPDVASWPRRTAERLLGGTDLGAALLLVERELAALSAKAHAAAGVTLDVEDLRWARGTLLSRRFTLPVGTSEGGDSGESDSDVSDAAGTSGTVGVLIPLFDELNHSPSGATVSLTSITADGDFVCLGNNSQPVAAGEEIFADYGSDKSNEELLAMYGFALDRNPSDAVALMLARPDDWLGGAPMTPVRHTIGRTGITAELWEALAGEDEDESGEENEAHALTALRAVAVNKIEALAAAEAVAVETAKTAGAFGVFIGYYRSGLREVLTALIAECDLMAKMLVN